MQVQKLIQNANINSLQKISMDAVLNAADFALDSLHLFATVCQWTKHARAEVSGKISTVAKGPKFAKIPISLVVDAKSLAISYMRWKW